MIDGIVRGHLCLSDRANPSALENALYYNAVTDVAIEPYHTVFDNIGQKNALHPVVYREGEDIFP